MAKKEKIEQAPTLVYVGPSIPGIANQFTFYNKGVPRQLKEGMWKNQMVKSLVIPLEQLPAAMEMLQSKSGHIFDLYKLMQENM